MDRPDEHVPSRRKAFAMIFAAIAGSAAVLASTEEAEAKRGGRGGRGRPFGWGRGRKRGWYKRGGPKWRW